MTNLNLITILPTWIIALCSVFALIISVITLFKSRKYFTEYALVSSDGTVLSHKGFSHYGLQVRFNLNPDPEYLIEFAKVPSYFEVTNREGGVVSLEQESPLSYKLHFIGAGLGSPYIQCNFKIQAY